MVSICSWEKAKPKPAVSLSEARIQKIEASRLNSWILYPDFYILVL